MHFWPIIRQHLKMMLRLLVVPMQICPLLHYSNKPFWHDKKNVKQGPKKKVSLQIKFLWLNHDLKKEFDLFLLLTMGLATLQQLVLQKWIVDYGKTRPWPLAPIHYAKFGSINGSQGLMLVTIGFLVGKCDLNSGQHLLRRWKSLSPSA